MSKVLVDPAALEEAAKWLEVHSSSSGSAEAFSAEALREAIARAAEAEGAVPVVCYLRAFQDGTPHWTEDCVCEDAVYPNHDGDETYSMPMVRQADHLAALSAVTAERDRLRKDAERYRWLRDKSEALHGFYLSTPIWMTGVRFRPENVDSTIDAALAAKEA